jgi:hypothetical protein
VESRHVDPALDVQDDLIGVFRVLFEVALEQDKTVVGLRTVELAAVPKGAYQKTPSVYSPTVNSQRRERCTYSHFAGPPAWSQKPGPEGTDWGAR